MAARAWAVDGRIDRVSRETVVRYWLDREWAKSECDRDPGALTADEALDALLTEKPGAAAFFWRDAPVTCYRLWLSRAGFDRLRVVPGPEELGWRALAPEGTVVACARRIDGGDSTQLARRSGVDIRAIERLTREDGPVDPLVVSTRRGAVPWHVVDGNHRAVATAFALARGADYEPVPVYLCVGANPILGPLVQRLRGLVRRLRRRDVSKTG